MSFLLSRSEHMRRTMPSSRVRKTKVLGFGTNDADYVVDPRKTNGGGGLPCVPRVDAHAYQVLQQAFSAQESYLRRCFRLRFVGLLYEIS